MPRPPNADAAATRRKILEAACEIVVDEGNEALSARAVARRAGVSPSLVHHHFIDRDGLVDVVIDTMYERVHELGHELLGRAASGESIEALVGFGIREAFRHVRAHQPYTRLLLVNIIRTGELDAARSEGTQGPLLFAASAALAGRLGHSERAVRMRIRSLVLMLSRYGVFNDSELARLVGGGDDPIAAVEDHLEAMARLMLLK